MRHMSKELLLVVETVANEKDVSREIIFEALEEALAAATRKNIHSDADIRVSINRDTGEYIASRHWIVVEEDIELKNPHAELYIDILKEKGTNATVGDEIQEIVPAAEFGRIAAMSARQVIMQKVKQAERNKLIEQYQEKLGKVVYATVKRVTRDFIIVDIGDNVEAILPRAELIGKEFFRLNDKLRACLVKVDADAKGNPLILSRSDKRFISALFELEVPEIAEEIIEIIALARDVGSRSKVAVKTNDKRIDPVGACIGMRGSRIQPIIDELQGEKLDIVTWDENLAQFAINALAPAEVVSIVIDEDKGTMDIAVSEENMPQAIGKNGQNVRLASEIVGWKINVLPEKEVADKKQQEIQSIANIFIDALDVDEDVAYVLVEEGLTGLEEVAYIAPEELASIEGFDEEIAQELQERARNVLITQALSQNQPQEDLLKLPDMTQEIANKLALERIVSTEDLAELSIDELQDIVDIDEALASKLILAARAPWFSKSSNNNPEQQGEE